MKKLISAALLSLALLTPVLVFGQGTTTIANLPAANPLNCTEVLPLWQGGFTRKVPGCQLGIPYTGSVAPYALFTGQEWWNNATNPLTLSLYDGSQWISLGSLDTSAHKWAAAPATSISAVNLNAGTLTTPQTGTLFQGQAADGVEGRFEADTFGNIATFTGVVYGGTRASPTALTSGTQLTGINAKAYNGSAIVGPIYSFRGYAAENIASGHQGSKACIATTPIASTTMADALCVNNDGSVVLGAPTGGDECAFCLNAAGGIFDNGTRLRIGATVQGWGTSLDAINAGTWTGATSITTVGTLTAPVMTTPTLGVASGTSLVLGGATIGGNALAITGTMDVGALNATISLSRTSTGTGGFATQLFRNSATNIWSIGLRQSNTNDLILNQENSTGNVVIAGGGLSFAPNGSTSGDTGLSRDSVLGAGNLDLGNGTANNKSGTLNAASAIFTGAVSTGNLTLGSANFLAWAGPRSAIGSPANGSFTFQNNSSSNVLTLTIPASNVAQFGAADAAAPIAQTLSFQNVVAGTANVAGANTTINLSQGTGTGIGGNLTFQCANHGTTGSTQNALAACFTINGDTNIISTKGTFAGGGDILAAAAGALSLNGRSQIRSPADGIFTISNTAQTDFSRLQFGGTTASFPAIKRTTTALNFRLADDTADAPITAGAATLSGALTTNVTGSTQCLQVNSSGVVAGSGGSCGAAAATLPTRQVLTSGSGATYTTPASVRQIRIRMVGGGGGGGGTSTANDAGAGGAGGFTSFDNAGTNYKATGGTGGSAGVNNDATWGGQGGSGGTGGTAPNTQRFPGNPGASTPTQGASGTRGGFGGGGGDGFGGGGQNGVAAIANSGGGGAGANAGGSSSGGGGGGGGEAVEIIINSPSGTYTYTVAAGGTAGAAGSGSVGNVGATGRIIVDEYY